MKCVKRIFNLTFTLILIALCYFPVSASAMNTTFETEELSEKDIISIKSYIQMDLVDN